MTMRGSWWSCALLAACATTDPDPQWLSRKVAIEAAAATSAPLFDVPAALQIGFDDVQAGGVIAVGDRVLFGVRMDRDDDVQVRYMQAEVQGIETKEWTIPPHSFINDTDQPITAQERFVVARATVHDADGRVLGEDTVRLIPANLERGLASACRGDALPANYGKFASRQDEMATQANSAIVTLLSILRVARGSPPLRALLWQVVDAPSIFSLIGHLGVKVSVAANFTGSAQDATFAVGAEALPTWTAPIELQINGSPALRCRVRCTDPHSPLALGAGIVELRAASPSHPHRTVTMALLGARRATGASR